MKKYDILEKIFFKILFMSRRGFEFGPRDDYENVDAKKRNQLENTAEEFGLGKEIAEEAVNPTDGKKTDKNQEKTSENTEKKLNPENENRPSYETSVKNGVEKIKEAEEAEKTKNSLPNGETTANQNLES